MKRNAQKRGREGIFLCVSPTISFFLKRRNILSTPDLSKELRGRYRISLHMFNLKGKLWGSSGWCGGGEAMKSAKVYLK